MHGTPYGMVREPVLGPLGAPCAAPPWGVMGAFSLDTGEILWRVPLGTTPDRIPWALFEQGLPSLSGVVVTAGGLVISGNTTDGFLRAHDAETGAVASYRLALASDDAGSVHRPASRASSSCLRSTPQR